MRKVNYLQLSRPAGFCSGDAVGLRLGSQILKGGPKRMRKKGGDAYWRFEARSGERAGKSHLLSGRGGVWRVGSGPALGEKKPRVFLQAS